MPFKNIDHILDFEFKSTNNIILHLNYHFLHFSFLQAPIFKMSCKIQSNSKYLPDLSEVCVQTLPRSSVLLSEGVKICFEWSPGMICFP